MDNTSPGNLPTSLGNVWVGETRPTPEVLARLEGLHGENFGCIVDESMFPCFVNGKYGCGCSSAGRCWMHGGPWSQPVPVAPPAQPLVLSPIVVASPISNADIERIARRAAEIVVDLLRDRLPLRVTRSVRPEVAIEDD